jgi:thymidylate kinase
MTSSVPVICVDGPSGAGKGTLSQHLANAFSWHLLDSGALYRVVGYACRQANVSLDDETAVAQMARALMWISSRVKRASPYGYLTKMSQPPFARSRVVLMHRGCGVAAGPCGTVTQAAGAGQNAGFDC